MAVVGDSPAVAARWHVAAGLVFIDGGHGEAPAWADYLGWAPHVAAGGWLAIHDVFEDPADGGRPPFEIYRRALSSGEFAEEPSAGSGSLRVLRRVTEPRSSRGPVPAGATRPRTAERPGSGRTRRRRRGRRRRRCSSSAPRSGRSNAAGRRSRSGRNRPRSGAGAVQPSRRRGQVSAADRGQGDGALGRLGRRHPRLVRHTAHPAPLDHELVPTALSRRSEAAPGSSAPTRTG